MTDRRLLMKALAGAAFLGMTGANAAKSFTIGYLALLPGEDRMSFMARFMRRLDELGYKNGQNLRLIYRSAEGQPQLLSRSSVRACWDEARCACHRIGHSCREGRQDRLRWRPRCFYGCW